jgi:hypothetical protein
VDLLGGFAATAIEQNERPSGEDLGRLAFELNGVMLAADAKFIQQDDLAVLGLSRR